ncbi:tetraspanin-36-like [Saccostrea echinata]|uniref:tetraspanin-36-like n=1 Tax=Saccostrea echinata TaxID=191078 RepID=UPI002A81F3CC|nr:tetraspanin-36-like [Saccostrea echinata]
MSGCTMTSKVGLILIGLIFWAVAAGLFFVGGWVFNTYKHFDEIAEANFTLIPASIIIAVGVMMFVVGLVGCAAAFKENKCLLAVLFSFLLVILTALITSGALGYGFRSDVTNAVENGLHKAINAYNSNSTQRDQVDYLQRNLKCCGVNNASDWLSAKTWAPTSNKTVPESCCVADINCTEEERKMIYNPKYIYQKGCYEKLEHEFMSNLAYIAGTAIGLAVILVLGMICSCILFCRSKEVRYEALGGQYAGLRV